MNQNKKTITPVIAKYYGNNDYTDDEIKLLETLVLPSEWFKYVNMTGNTSCTNKQRFLAISSIIDLYPFKK